MSQIKINNNKLKSDSIEVSKLKKGDVVRVYKKSTGGKLVVKSKKGIKITAAVSIKQLSEKPGNVYVSVTSNRMTESKRTKVSYRAPKKTIQFSRGLFLWKEGEKGKKSNFFIHLKNILIKKSSG